MSPGEPKIHKPKLNKDILKQNGINFLEHVHESEELPEWIRPIPQHLVCFHGQLLYKNMKGFKREFNDFCDSKQDGEEALAARWSVMPPELRTDPIWIQRRIFTTDEKKLAESKIELEICQDIRKMAIKLREKQAAETKWIDLLHNDVFQTFDKVYSYASTYDERYHQWALHRDLHWNEFPNRINLNERVTQRTGPKPDLTYAFPIIDTSKAPKSVDQFDPQVKAFSLRVLNHLRNSERAKLRSAPTTSLKRYDEKQKNSELGDEHLTCFPWAIVEVKRSEPDKPSETFCYCQAANASAEALVLREELAQKAKDAAQTHEAMVIFAFTCIGPSVKLWVTYREQKTQHITMRCIWATSLEFTWGVLVLRMIVHNMRGWIYSRVKRDISKWVLKIYDDLSPPSVLSPDGDVVQQRRRAASAGDVNTPKTPDRSAARLTPSREKTAPASVGRRRRQTAYSPSRSRRAQRDLEDFIVDDDEIESLPEHESENEADEVSELVEQSIAWWPELEENSLEEQDEVYFIDDQRIVMRLPKTRKSLAVDSLRKKDRAEDRARRCSSRF